MNKVDEDCLRLVIVSNCGANKVAQVQACLDSQDGMLATCKRAVSTFSWQRCSFPEHNDEAWNDSNLDDVQHVGQQAGFPHVWLISRMRCGIAHHSEARGGSCSEAVSNLDPA